MEIKMCTCPNGHYYNADIYSSCPECGAAAGGSAGFGGAQGIPPTAPAGAPMGGFGGAQGIPPTAPAGAPMGGGIGVTEPIFPGGSGYSSQPIPPTEPASSFGASGVGVTVPVGQYNPNSKNDFPSTVSAYDLPGKAGMSTEPVVGWLVCVEGPLRGVDFRLHDGYNFIGREEGDIHIKGDNAVSRQRHAVVAFYAKRNTFHVGPVEGRNIIELNDQPVFNHVEMKNYDILTVGNTKLMLVALCGPNFNWTAGAQNG